MANKTNIRSLRFSDELAELIERQQGQNFTEKFENLVTRCVWEVPAREKELAELERRIRAVWPSMDRKSVRPAKRLAWSLYRVSKGLFRRVMKWYYRRTLYRGLDL